MPTSPVKTRIPLTSFGHLITEVKVRTDIRLCQLSSLHAHKPQTPLKPETVSSVYGGKITYQLSYGVMVVNNRVTVIVRVATWWQQKQALDTAGLSSAVRPDRHNVCPFQKKSSKVSLFTRSRRL